MKNEIIVYVINGDSGFDFNKALVKRDYEAIMTEAEKSGSIYTLGYFQDCINDESLMLCNSFIYISNKNELNKYLCPNCDKEIKDSDNIHEGCDGNYICQSCYENIIEGAILSVESDQEEK